MSKTPRSLVLFGSVEPLVAKAVRDAADAVGAPFVLRHLDGVDGDDLDPIAALVPVQGAGDFERCRDVKSHARFSDVPVIAIGDAHGSLSFEELFQCGGDDLVRSGDAQSLARRLRAVCGRAAPPQSARRAGAAIVVAGASATWRTLVVRALANAGVVTRTATTVAEAIEASRGCKAVVASEDLDPRGVEVALADARRSGSDAPWVVVAVPKRIAHVLSVVRPFARVAVIDSYGPPANALFVANELAAASATENRSAARMLYGTSVSFRAAGREDEDDVGFVYNASANGVFVRTLAPLERGDDVWLELWAPRSSRRVRLAGKVAWRRPFGTNESATVPPGFGVHVTDGLAGDLDRWRDGCAVLERDALRANAARIAPGPKRAARCSDAPRPNGPTLADVECGASP